MLHFHGVCSGKLVVGIWDSLEEKDRQNIYSQLYGYICQLQALEFKTPGPIGGGVSEGALFTAYGAGPFHSSKDLEDWYNNRLLVSHDFHQATHLRPGIFSGAFQTLVMCHLDLSQHNLILDEVGKVWLIDWGLAGAYPPWFEEAQLSWGVGPGVSWQSGLLSLLGKETYKENVATMEAVYFALTTGGYCQPRAKVENNDKQ